MLRSRCLPPSLRSATSSKLSPLYVPVSPVSRAEGCKPCPVPLCPYNTEYRDTSVCSSKNSPYIRTRLVTPQKLINTLGQPRPQTLSLLPRRAAARAAGERRQVYPCLYPCPRTHVEMRGRNGPGRRAPNPHTNLIQLLLLLYVAATAGVVLQLLRLIYSGRMLQLLLCC